MTGRLDPPWTPDPDADEGMRIRLGENVRLLRARAHVSQEVLAFRADVHRTQISMFETGRRQPMLGSAIRLAAGLEVEMATLLDGITYRPQLFSMARGEFDISPRKIFEIGTGDRRAAGGAA